MGSGSKLPATIDEYIKPFPSRVRAILERVRRTAREAAPAAEEVISYRMPALKLGGILVYFAAFKNHIGLYPPVAGDPKLVKAAAPYAGEKGNLRFPLDGSIPYDLIKQIVALHAAQSRAKQDRAKQTQAKPKHAKPGPAKQK